MKERWKDTLSGLIDGDPVDAEVVAEALESPDGRRLLVDFVAIRAALHKDTATPSVPFYTRMQPSLAITESHRSRPVQGVPFRIAAALVAASLLMGFGIDSWRHRRIDAPPSAARVLRFDPSEWTSAQGGVR